MNFLTVEDIEPLWQKHCHSIGPIALQDLAFARAIEAAVIKKLAAGVSVEPVAYVKFWAAQQVSPDGNVEADEGLEVCRSGDVGMDGIAAEPVVTLPQLQVERAAARVQALEEAIEVCEGRDYLATPFNCADAIRALLGKEAT